MNVDFGFSLLNASLERSPELDVPVHVSGLLGNDTLGDTHSVSNVVEDRHHVAHVGDREDRVEHLALLTVRIT